MNMRSSGNCNMIEKQWELQHEKQWELQLKSEVEQWELQLQLLGSVCCMKLTGLGVKAVGTATTQ